MGLFILSPVRRVWQSGSAASVTGTLADTALATIIVPAGSMGLNGRLEIDAFWTFTNSGNNKSLRIWWNGIGGTLIGGINLTATQSYVERRTIANRNSVSSQVAIKDDFGNGGFGAAAVDELTAAVDTGTDVSLVLSGTLSNTGETITLSSYSVKLVVPQ